MLKNLILGIFLRYIPTNIKITNNKNSIRNCTGVNSNKTKFTNLIHLLSLQYYSHDFNLKMKNVDESNHPLNF